jgi:hypothetical protein
MSDSNWRDTARDLRTGKVPTDHFLEALDDATRMHVLSRLWPRLRGQVFCLDGALCDREYEGLGHDSTKACGVTDDGWRCCRPKAHAGPHVACSGRGPAAHDRHTWWTT